MKIRPVGTELFHAEGRTDMKLIVAAVLRNRIKIKCYVDSVVTDQVPYLLSHLVVW